MDVLGNLQNAWGALNRAAEDQYQRHIGDRLDNSGSKSRKGAGSMNASGAGKAVISTLINGAMEEHMMAPMEAKKAEAQRRFDANLARERHARSGGRVMHRPPISM